MRFAILSITSFLILAACTPDQPGLNEPAETAAAELQTVEPTATKLATDSTDDQREQPIGEAPEPLPNIAADTWDLKATFRWLASKTLTDVTYTYEGQFQVNPDGSIQSVGIPVGEGRGVAGVNVNDECIETNEIFLDFSYAISGLAENQPVSDGNQDWEMIASDAIEGDEIRMFLLSLGGASIATIDVPRFETCMPGLEQAFLDSLATFWIEVIPVMPLEFRQIPATDIIFCPGTLSYEEEGLGVLEVCYEIEKS